MYVVDVAHGGGRVLHIVAGLRGEHDATRNLCLLQALYLDFK